MGTIAFQKEKALRLWKGEDGFPGAHGPMTIDDQLLIAGFSLAMALLKLAREDDASRAPGETLHPEHAEANLALLRRDMLAATHVVSLLAEQVIAGTYDGEFEDVVTAQVTVMRGALYELKPTGGFRTKPPAAP